MALDGLSAMRTTGIVAASLTAAIVALATCGAAHAADPAEVLAKEQVVFGLTEGDTFQPGNTFTRDARISVYARDFPPHALVRVVRPGTSSETPLQTTTGAPAGQTVDAYTDADGNVPPGSFFVIGPQAPAEGTVRVTVTVGNDSVNMPINIEGALGSATLLTGSVRPGGRIAFGIRNGVGVSGEVQHVLVRLNGAYLTCAKPDEYNRLRVGVADVPADLPTGFAEIEFSAGSSCNPPAGNPELPSWQSSTPSLLQVSNAAPVLRSAPTATPGSDLRVYGAGLPPGAQVDALFGGYPGTAAVSVQGTYSVAADGTFDGVFRISPDARQVEYPLAFTVSQGFVTMDVYRVVPPEIPSAAASTTSATAPPAGTPTLLAPQLPTAVASAPTVSRVALRRSSVAVTLKGSVPTGSRVDVTSASNLKLRATGKATAVIFGARIPAKPGTTVLPLTADGERALRRYGKVKVVARVTVPGTKTVSTKTVTLRR